MIWKEHTRHQTHGRPSVQVCRACCAKRERHIAATLPCLVKAARLTGSNYLQTAGVTTAPQAGRNYKSTQGSATLRLGLCRIPIPYVRVIGGNARSFRLSLHKVRRDWHSIAARLWTASAPSISSLGAAASIIERERHSWTRVLPRSKSVTRHVQHRVPRRDAPPKRHAAGSNSARNVKIPFPFIDQAVTPPKRCLACVRYDPDTGNPNLTPMRVSSQRQVWPRRHLRKPDRIMSKYDGGRAW